MRRVYWEGGGDWRGEWQDVLDTPLLPPVDEYCESSVVFDDNSPHCCGEPAIAWRLDSEDDGEPWPACQFHS